MKSNQITIDVDSGNERTFQVKSHKAGEVMGFPNSEKVDGPHYKHKVFVTDREVTKSFYFYGSIKDYEEGKDKLDRDDLLHAFGCFLDDAISGDMSIEDFTSEFGYEIDDFINGRIQRIHKACQKALEKINDFGIFTSEVYDIANTFREDYEI